MTGAAAGMAAFDRLLNRPATVQPLKLLRSPGSYTRGRPLLMSPSVVKKQTNTEPTATTKASGAEHKWSARGRRLTSARQLYRA